MKNLILTLLVTASASFGYAQNLEGREEINLSGFDYKIYTKQTKSAITDETVYVIPNQTDTIFHDALIKDLKADKELYRGIYGKNGQEIHFLQFDLQSDKINHKVYAPNKEGRLVLIKESKNLDAYPKDFPPKFKNNKPIHPIYPGESMALYKWVESNVYPILAQKHKSDAKGNAVMVLDIAIDGSAKLSEVKNLKASSETLNKLREKLSKMPKWETKIQGYDVAGIVFIPVNF